MKLLTKNLKTAIAALWHDKELVNKLKSSNPNRDQLYNYLTNGKITLQEYVQLTK